MPFFVFLMGGSLGPLDGSSDLCHSADEEGVTVLSGALMGYWVRVSNNRSTEKARCTQRMDF